MKAMILAAGRGQRMGSLTAARPKPLLRFRGKALIEHLTERLGRAGFRDIVINLAYRGRQIEAALGDGARYGVSIRYSAEGPEPLETGGGIKRALPLLGPGPFLVVNGDIWSDFPFARLRAVEVGLAHLVLVDNPPHRPGGDFAFAAGRVGVAGAPRLTFSGIGLYREELLADEPGEAFPLAPLLVRAMAEERVSGEHYRGGWMDVGTPDRLAALRLRDG